MKKLLLTFVAAVVALSASAQFRATPYGLVSTEDMRKDYVVIELPGKTQEEIFQSVVSFLKENYCQRGYTTIRARGTECLKFVVDCPVRNQYNMVKAPFLENGFAATGKPYLMVTQGKPRADFRDAQKQVFAPAYYYYEKYNAFLHQYSVVFNFKDGKLKMYVPRIHHFTISKKGNIRKGYFLNPIIGRKQSLYKPDGTPQKQNIELIRGIENYFNYMANNAGTYSVDKDW